MEEYLNKRIEHAQKRLSELKELHGENPTVKYNYYGGQSLGYWQGLLAAYESVLDKIVGEQK